MKEKEKWAEEFIKSKKLFKDDYIGITDLERAWAAGFEFGKHKCIVAMADTPHASFRLEQLGESETNPSILGPGRR